MNVPNALTLLRIFFVPLLVAVMLQQSLTQILALGIFLLAAATDLLDGYLARRWNQVSTVGMLLDPIADKLLISAALISLVQLQRVPAWLAILLIGREFAVSGLRSIAASEGFAIKASELGKTKMVAQVAAISLLILVQERPSLTPIANWVLWGCVVFSLSSAAGYFVQFWRAVDDSIKARRRTELIQMERQRAATLRAGSRVEPD